MYQVSECGTLKFSEMKAFTFAVLASLVVGAQPYKRTRGSVRDEEKGVR
jgi:hypothetical protein